MILRPLTFLILIVVASSGCATPAVSRRPVCRGAIDPQTVEALGIDSMDSLSHSEPVSSGHLPSIDAMAHSPFPVRRVNWSVFEEEEAPSPDDGESCAPRPEWRLCRNLRNLGPTLWDDTKGVVQVENAVILGVSLAAAIGIRQDLDDRVREATEDNPIRWGNATRIFGYLGEAQYQVPVLFLLSGYAVHTNDPECYDFSEALISAYTINGLATLAIKGISNTDRPDTDWNGGHWGFPSFHAGSAFTIAAVVEEYHGWAAGLPAYTLAGLISWSRIDERDHDLSDVVFGAAMGWVIGKSVASRHLDGDGRVVVFPWMHPTEPALGMAVETRF